MKNSRNNQPYPKIRPRRVALQIDAGALWVNRHAVLNPGVPADGVKQSGFGVEFRQEGLKEYTQVQVLSAEK